MAKATSTSINRQKEIISAAIEVFAEMGYYRATTAKVAERANISQPYVFRFFGTKEALLIEALKVSFDRIIDSFQGVIHLASSEQLEQELIAAYSQIMMEYRNEILLQMQAQTIREDVVVSVMQQGFREIHTTVYNAFRQAGIEQAMKKTMLFLARGMLCNISMSLDLPELMKIDE
ncbi:TetR/AcrR family transcriptional regulator [Paenibacillus sp. CMAA1739]|uniref:TetR/AcrR family transcriptional regulator n=1 Tax=Paenibacillus ottowii TaxID=2315729 RepID=UPI002730400C|nr:MULTISPECIES: TetR/AcrR family transcriptional regulator [Paenibacillus]MDP1512724.1 TetR/AcrR family transcriptional regulator [Paenibacillus ottowii]MEC4568798.1 TetR/AcrR family transcriptional regulator [Paenibacillus sp. CMAA1739]